MACVRIERAENGYTVSMTDPKIEAINRKNSLKGEYGYANADREYVFDDIGDMMKFLQKNLDKALPAQDFDSSFDSMSDEDD